VPALSSSLIGPALEQIADLPAGDRALLAAGHRRLLEHLARVPDPRKRRGVRHSLSSVLAAAIAAVMAGARSFTAIGEWIADAPPLVLASLGIRRDPLTRRFEPPDEATIRRVLESVDAAVLDTEVGAWLSARVQTAGPRSGRRTALAVDGMALRGTRHASADGQAVHLLAVLDHQAWAVLGQVDVDVDVETNEVTRFAPLLEHLDLTGHVVTADALHTQRGHAELRLVIPVKDFWHSLAVGCCSKLIVEVS
jgi:predicted transposase YbfD/YdcC